MKYPSPSLKMVCLDKRFTNISNVERIAQIAIEVHATVRWKPLLQLDQGMVTPLIRAHGRLARLDTAPPIRTPFSSNPNRINAGFLSSKNLTFTSFVLDARLSRTHQMDLIGVEPVLVTRIRFYMNDQNACIPERCR